MSRIALFAMLLFPLSIGSVLAADDAAPVRVLVWDERQPQQKEAYPDFLGNVIAKHLDSLDGIEVRSVGIDDDQQGLSADNLDWAQVLIWWGHARHADIKQETARDIVERIKSGKLSLVALHSAHWSMPFVEAMNERVREDAKRRFPGEKIQFDFVPPPGRYVPTKDSVVTPAYYAYKQRGEIVRVRIDMPSCIFPEYRADGAPSTIEVLKPDHPLAKNLPTSFVMQHTEMYNEPFHVPEPDEVILKESWKTGESFRSGCLWKIGKGRVFYFRPGHETFGIFLQREPLQVVANAVQWLGRAEPSD
jgi:trehalose utilization protein